MGKKPHTSLLPEIIGWYGMAAVLGAYIGTSASTISPSSLLFLGLNGTGSAALAYHSFIKKDTQPLVLNIIWMVVALVGLTRMLS